MHTVKSTLTMRHNCLALLALRQPSADYLRFAPIRYARPGRRRALFSFSPDVHHAFSGLSTIPREVEVSSCKLGDSQLHADRGRADGDADGPARPRKMCSRDHAYRA